MNKYFLIIILIFLFSFLESIRPIFPLTLPSLLFLAADDENDMTILTAFGTGLIQDFLQRDILGKTSLFYLFSILIIFLYKRRFQANNPLFFVPTTFGLSFLFLFLKNHALLWLPTILSTLFGLVLVLIFKKKRKIELEI